MFETLLRPHEVHQVPKLVSIDSIVEQVKLHEIKKEHRRIQQVEASERKRNNLKRKREQTEEGEGGPDLDLGTGDQKRRRDGDAIHPSTAVDVDITVTKHALDPPPMPLNRNEARLAVLATSTPMSKLMPEVRGHTSYLTFATLLPALSGVDVEKGGSVGADVSWENMETTTAFDQLIASIPEDVGFLLSFCK
jgi:tRNA (adenine57-N1/adenine58-N1)-methyltransferase catalytic subunit